MQITTITNKNGYIETRKLDYGEFGLLMSKIMSDSKMEITQHRTCKRDIDILDEYNETNIVCSSEDGYFVSIFLVEKIKEDDFE